MKSLSLTTVPGIPLVQPGDDLAEVIWRALARGGLSLEDGDVVVVTQKAVSKAEGRVVSLEGVTPSAEALRLGEVTGKDPRLVEVVLLESREVLRAARGRLIVEQSLGIICANAGVDLSNVPHQPGSWVSLLPEDPDASAERVRAGLRGLSGRQLAVLISDSQGRPFRHGCVGVAIGVAGLPPLWDRRGQRDLFGRPLASTVVALADLVASAAIMVMGEADEGTPVVIVRGLEYRSGPASAQELLRSREEDLFR